MSYVVLARKWRPKQFDEVVGQEHVARTLKNAILQNRVAHAFLFTGARGVGKTSTARILAKALNCQAQDGATPTPCDKCDSCKEITSGQSVDVFEIDGASNRGINEIRELRESVRYAPSRGRMKIYIIDEVHMLTTEAFNALLKTLEEPPPHVIFVFATTEPQKIPVTILSRCQRYDFKRIGQNDIVRHLELLCKEEGITAEKSALQIVARQAAGGMRDALSLLDQIISFAGNIITETSVQEILGVANRSHLFDLSEAVIQRDAERCLLILDDVNRFGYDMQQFSGELVTHLRDLMVLSVVKDPERVTNLTTTEVELARRQIDQVPTDLLHRYFSLAAATVPEMARSSFPKLIFEMMLVRMSQLEPLIGLDVLVDRLAALESEFDGEPAPVAIRSQAPSAPRQAYSPPVVPTPPQPVVQIEEIKPPSAPAATPVMEEATEVREVSPAAPEPEPMAVESKPVVTQTESVPKPKPEPEPVPAAPKPEPVAETYAEETDDEDDQDDEDIEQEWTPAPTVVTPQLPVSEKPVLLDEATEVLAEPLSNLDVPESRSTEAIQKIQRLSIADIAALSPYHRWEKVVDAMRDFNKPLAAVCEYGYPERFADHVVELSFMDKYIELIKEPKRLDVLGKVIVALYGPDWKIDLQLLEGSVAVQSIADTKEAIRRQRRVDLEDQVRNNPIVEKARQIFEVPEDAVKVQVRLFEDM
jgi:DNA polymerase-3 subunit gamma/tau